MDFELETATSPETISRADLMMIHARFGHVSEQTLRKILTPAYGFKQKIPKVSLLPCVICNLYKARNEHRTSTGNRALHVLEKIHLDLAIMDQSRQNEQNSSFLIIVDDFSGYIWTFPLEDKSQTTKI